LKRVGKRVHGGGSEFGEKERRRERERERV